MEYYKIILDEPKLDEFIELLPDNNKGEAYYICLFGRHKYDETFPQSKNAGQLARMTADKSEIKSKLLRLECPLGSYLRDGVIASQECLAVYITVNPRSYARANREILIELAKQFAAGKIDFNPVSAATTAVHRAVERKFFLDFDFDRVEIEEHLPAIKEVLPPGAFSILKTRGGFHLLVHLDKVKGDHKWHPAIAKLKNCDVRGSNTLTPVAGCTQGGFTPYLVNLD